MFVDIESEIPYLLIAEYVSFIIEDIYLNLGFGHNKLCMATIYRLSLADQNGPATNIFLVSLSNPPSDKVV